jgi:hypothetical protein
MLIALARGLLEEIGGNIDRKRAEAGLFGGYVGGQP